VNFNKFLKFVKKFVGFFGAMFTYTLAFFLKTGWMLLEATNLPLVFLCLFGVAVLPSVL